MKLSFFGYVSGLLLFAVSMIGFSNRIVKEQGLPASNNDGNTVNTASVVYPNPYSGILNVKCNDNLQSPLTMKISDNNGAAIQTINLLNTEGTINHKFIQINAANLKTGEYKMIVTDTLGNSTTRYFYIQK